MQIPYGTLSYQIPTSRNCKPFRTQLVHYYWLYTRHKHSRPARQNQCPTNRHLSQTPCYPSLTNDSNTNTFLKLSNAHLDPQIN